jgi:hypothetical protein
MLINLRVRPNDDRIFKAYVVSFVHRAKGSSGDAAQRVLINFATQSYV